VKRRIRKVHHGTYGHFFVASSTASARVKFLGMTLLYSYSYSQWSTSKSLCTLRHELSDMKSPMSSEQPAKEWS
jgi:hypothetical protein